MTVELLPVILCGGSGTRLFPLSRESHPKQFLRLTGPQTMLQQTAMRLQGWEEGIRLAPTSTLVCHEEHRFLAASQWAEAEGGGIDHLGASRTQHRVRADTGCAACLP